MDSDGTDQASFAIEVEVTATSATTWFGPGASCTEKEKVTCLDFASFLYSKTPTPKDEFRR
jgi:hypothetical protein